MSRTTELDAARRDSYPRWSREKVRFGDLDRHNHVNNVALCSMLENGRVEMREALVPGVAADPRYAWVLVTFSVTFLGSMRYPGVVDIGTRVIEIGRSSFELGQGAFDGERCIATARAKAVCVERETERAIALPAEFRAALEATRRAADERR